MKRPKFSKTRLLMAASLVGLSFPAYQGARGGYYWFGIGGDDLSKKSETRSLFEASLFVIAGVLSYLFVPERLVTAVAVVASLPFIAVAAVALYVLLLFTVLSQGGWPGVTPSFGHEAD